MLKKSIRWKIPDKDEVPPECEVVRMSPQEFLQSVPSPCDIKHTAYELRDFEPCWSRSSLEYIMKKINIGKKIEIPFLDYNREFWGYPTHEGRHRALLAYKLGEQKIPVVVCRKRKKRP